MNYNYKKNMDKQIIKLRFVHSYKENYCLQFKTTGWFAKWITVEEYNPTISASDRPGGISSYGNWENRWWSIESNEYGKKLLDKLRAELKTVGDIYHAYIESDEKRMADDYKRYHEYWAKINSVSTIIK